MDPSENSQPTQQATQNVVDPRRLGQQNSGFSDEDISDIICLLLPRSDPARREVARIAKESPQHMVGREDAENVDLDYSLEDNASSFALAGYGVEEHAIVLRLSSKVKDPLRGFAVGRNAARCDITIANDPKRRLSNIHFRIFINEYGVLMLEDQSTNGTVVDEVLLKARGKNESPIMRTLSSGSKITILMHEKHSDVEFLVRVPRRSGEHEAAYCKNMVAYLKRIQALAEVQDQTISAGPAGHVDLFPQEFRRPTTVKMQGQLLLDDITTQKAPTQGHKRMWTESHHYNRVEQIGRGAFATVHKVTRKFDGRPYAAKELDRQRFMKNGVLDQKVENEMKIMQNVQHPNIVQYIEHFDTDERMFVIIMEYVPGGDLGRLINRDGALPEATVKVMAAQLVGALGYLNQKNITHRDVKPDNILVQSQNPLVVKLTDFGLSKMVDNDQTFLRTFCGTLLYCAPEVYSEFAEYDDHGRRNPRNRHRRPPTGQRYDHAVDIWSLGGVLFYALTAGPPYPVRTGISHSELLHQIMTKKLDISPLRKAGISADGIEFLSLMLERRPEHRATVDELLDHPWLGGSGSVRQAAKPCDEVSDGELEQGASQLSLVDRQNVTEPFSDDEILDDEDDVMLGTEDTFLRHDSQKENYAVGQTQQPTLFGEVNLSAIGSSGVIGASRLNLPISESSFATTEIEDSYGTSQSSTPRQRKTEPGSQPNSLQVSSGGVRLSQGSYSVDELNNKTFDVASQSLGGAESILENLNMKSRGGINLQRSASEFSTSKRKPGLDSSDEHEGAPLDDRPTAKRLKSQGRDDSMALSDSDEDEILLYTMLPPIARLHRGRRIDAPVHKATFWTAGDTGSWHLQYPEMTQLQYDAFEKGAKDRGEIFRPGKSVLWEFAMKKFPPVDTPEEMPEQLDDAARGAPVGEGDETYSSHSSHSSHSSSKSPSTATSEEPETQLDTPLFYAQSKMAVLTGIPQTRRVASVESTPNSVVSGISFFVTESVTTWGRAAENTRRYSLTTESRVPKHAFKILLWKEAYDPSRDFRPWNRPCTKNEDSFFFYISTKATQGILINGMKVPSHEPKSPAGPSRYWTRLYDGDALVTWRSIDDQVQVQLVFRCNWGGSRRPRPSTSKDFPPPFLVSDGVARRLDDACHSTERRLRQKTQQQLKMAEAEHDFVERAKNIERERLRSLNFETSRAEACRALSVTDSQAVSPASAPPSSTETPLTGTPPEGQQTGDGKGEAPVDNRIVPNFKVEPPSRRETAKAATR